MNKKIFVVIKNFICGMVVGVANIIPGVSGGTMAVILDIYDELISSISNIKKDFKKSAKFLISIGLGCLLAIVLCSKGVSMLLENHFLITNFLFIGIIIGSAPMIYKRATADSFKVIHLIPCLVTFLIMIAMIVLPYDDASTVIEREVDMLSAFKYIFMGAIACICMLIPGISGSFVMLLFGLYGSITTAISEVNMQILIPIGIGCVLGLILGAKLIDFLLRRFPQATYFSILGFVIGSIPVIIDKIISTGNWAIDSSFAVGIVFLFVGLGVSLFFDSNFLKNIINKKLS